MFHIMWNDTARGTLELVNEFMAALRTYAPAGVQWRLDVAREAMPNADAVVEASLGGKEFRFLVETKATAVRMKQSPRPEQRVPGDVPVVLARYLSPTARSSLIREGWSYWDTTGNANLWSQRPWFLIKTEGAQRDPDPSQNEEPRSLKSLAGPGAARIVIWLAANRLAPSARELAKSTGTGIGTASRVVSLLRQENLLMATGLDGIVVEDPMDLVERWVQDYNFIKTNKAMRFRSPLGLDGTKAALERAVDPTEFAYTGLEAARRYFPNVTNGKSFDLPVSDLWIYAKDPLLVEREAMLIADKRGDIVLANGSFLGLDVAREWLNPGLHTATPWRVSGDLMSQTGRHAAVGIQLAQSLAEKGAQAWLR